MASNHISRSRQSGACCCRILPLILAVLCLFGIVGTWLVLEKNYLVTGVIRVDPLLSNIITGEKDTDGISNYDRLMATHAMMVTSQKVVDRVANDLAGKGLQFFGQRVNALAVRVDKKFGGKEGERDPGVVLKKAILDKVIFAKPAKGSEVILASMKWHDPAEATKIVDCFIRNYMAVEIADAGDEEEMQLAILRDEHKQLYSKIDRDRAKISAMANQYGSKKLAGRYDMNLERVGKLLSTLTEVEARRIHLQTQVAIAEGSGKDLIDPTQWVSLREEYVIKDQAVQAYTTEIISLEMDLIAARQDSPPDDPEIKRKEGLLSAMKKGLEEHKMAAHAAFNAIMKQETATANNKRLHDLETSLKQTKAHEDEIRSLLAKEDRQTIDLGQMNLAMQTLQDQIAMTEEMYRAISRRIAEFMMERKRPARISVAQLAEVDGIHDIRVHCTAGFAGGFVVLE